jgi:8-oxo-dGTP pyrophosphatase MutT (NUDIX family)
MSDIPWKPHTTVAALLEHGGRYLLVEEETEDGLRLNQPAGHVEWGERIFDACVRETQEETGYLVAPTSLVGIYQWSPPGSGQRTYLRFAFDVALTRHNLLPVGRTIANARHAAHAADAVLAELDTGIVRAVWLDFNEIVARRAEHRSPLTLQCVADHRAGRRYPLDLIQHSDR